MTAAKTTEHEDKHTGVRKEKTRKVGSKAQKKQENSTQGIRSNKVSRLCYKSRSGDLVTLYAIFFLLSSATISSYLVVGDDFG